MTTKTRTLQVTTSAGRTITVVEHQQWIDTGDKMEHSRLPGRKELRLQDGSLIAFDGEAFTLRSGEWFLPPA